ncbi:acyltransferase [Corynebacterium sp. HMSC072D12]|uniref:acyltransferase family protein n=1 Tax=Corynebacterium sp. HMSC072D12 TaxID=1739447 RepID=UPI0008A459E3|nr:acyltransferase [Corynebacterium sp. HMSC072D12]OFQ35361.1 acyltransferase [Corynebacterium sp. HMSC072D12]
MRFLPELEGVRALAALAVVITHVSFQTATGWAWAERLDYGVAVFFVLSGFLLWRRRHAHTAGQYLLSRVARLAPLYVVCVVAVLALLPDASALTLPQVITNLTGAQLYIADGLVPGLTQLWSLCVEFAFYAVLPLLAWGLDRFSARLRVVLLAVAGVLSLFWGFLPFVAGYESGDVNTQIWPPAYFSWFAVGMLAAEAEAARVRLRAGRIVRPVCWVVAVGCVWLASREWFGPQGLVHPEPGEFARRIAVGAVCGACIVVPVALAPRESWLASEWMRALGRWSYGVFMWHVAVLAIAFPLLGVSAFSGSVWDFVVVLAFTVVVSCVLSAATYVLVEVPGRDLIRSLAFTRGRIAVPRSLPRLASDSASASGSGSPASAAGSTDSAS